MSDARHAALVDRLAVYDTLVEVGVGHRPAVAAALADRNCTVTATDVHDRPVPASVAFVRDDVTDPDAAVYADADAVYALNLPPELHRPTRAVAREAGADFLFTTLGGDPPLVPVTRESLAGTGRTLFVADDARPG
ncbi:UPF0146 family protein [Halorientalis persicus]|uniref:UPF0146 family protein n=1 Tax=Halorientalis persicus TaxID=1367881 RepID=UPI000B8A14B0|nr:UPF0146 family protein [Halorientalis persicus]